MSFRDAQPARGGKELVDTGCASSQAKPTFRPGLPLQRKAWLWFSEWVSERGGDSDRWGSLRRRREAGRGPGVARPVLPTGPWSWQPWLGKTYGKLVHLPGHRGSGFSSYCVQVSWARCRNSHEPGTMSWCAGDNRFWRGRQEEESQKSYLIWALKETNR